MGPHGECYYNTLLCCDYFSSSSVVSRALSALCVYSKFGHHPHPVGYLCAKFRFFRGLHCCASTWRKIAYSFDHAPGTEALALQSSSLSTTGGWQKVNVNASWDCQCSAATVRPSCVVSGYASAHNNRQIKKRLFSAVRRHRQFEFQKTHATCRDGLEACACESLTIPIIILPIKQLHYLCMVSWRQCNASRNNCGCGLHFCVTSGRAHALYRNERLQVSGATGRRGDVLNVDYLAGATPQSAFNDLSFGILWNSREKIIQVNV